MSPVLHPAVAGLVGVMLVLGAPAQAQDSDCFRKVVEFAEGICAEFVDTSGGTSRQEFEGQIDAHMAGLLKRLTDLGGEVGASVSQEEYENILREDVPNALQEGRQCRLEVANSFFDRICGAPPAIAPEPASASRAEPAAQPAAQSFFDRQAMIEDPDGWTNVRSGKGTDFPIIGRIDMGEVFHTRVQDGSWWQVETPAGQVGYVHNSRIRLLPPS